MKKTISLILVTLVLVSMLMLTACSSEKAVVESVLTLDSNYVGQRTITVKYPLDTHIDSLEKKLEAKNPLIDSEKSTSPCASNCRLLCSRSNSCRAPASVSSWLKQA